MLVQAQVRHWEVWGTTLYLVPEQKSLTSASGWEALVECCVVLTISVKLGFCKGVNNVFGTEI